MNQLDKSVNKVLKKGIKDIAFACADGQSAYDRTWSQFYHANLRVSR